MISFTTKEFYDNKYLTGKQAVIDTALFTLYALKSTQRIKQYTLNIDENKPFIDELQMCCCEVAEYLYKVDKNELPSGISSETVGSHSVSYEKSEDIEKIHDRKIKSIIYTWLASTGYLYRGLR